jgi:hypothetical protein
MPSLSKHRSKKRNKDIVKDIRNQTKHIKVDKSPKAILQPQTSNKPAKIQIKLLFTPIKLTNMSDKLFKLKNTSIDLSLRDHQSMSMFSDKSKHNIDCLNELSFKQQTSCFRLKTTIPTQYLEKMKVYKFINLLMGPDINVMDNFKFTVGDEIIQKINSDNEIDSDCDEDMIKLSDKTLHKHLDEDSLHQCMCQIFDTTGEVDIHQTNKDYLVDEESQIQNNNERNHSTCHRLSLVPIFQEGIDQLTKMKIVESRTKRRMRLKRNYTFFMILI